tara:strand:- start:35779 stop:39321 length:3543 start_codon:yes stop_codon:yes gene_type:complete
MDMSEQKKMDTSKLKKFAQFARRSLIEQVASKLNLVLKEESSVRRELPQVVAKLETELKSKGKEQLIEQVAYIWFNRFCALRFMDVNVYNRIGVLSPAEGQFQPEILAEAKAGHIDESIVSEAARAKIFGLLDGSIKSRDGQSEAYRLLIVAVCNDYHRIMPYLFERIEDYTELLMPDDLLSGNSILAYTREAMTPEACESVECIGWLYQFYISEKKDKVFEGLKNNKKITPENIPAATQLFTPHWIVRYLVENSLGRLWMLNNPNSKVIEQMDYYIKPVEEEREFLNISSPEEIKLCDPACGSGHMLTYAYDLLYAIYLDAGYDSADIPELILTKNLYGIEIDERAAELAAFALSMKALKGNPNDDSNNRRRFFRNPIKPNICRLENISFKEDELDEYIEFVGRDLFTQDLRATLKEFEEADNFGSLIQPTLKNAEDVLATLETKDVSGQLFLTETHKRVLKVIKQADYLSQKYHVVVANPPYMGQRNMGGRLAAWLKEQFPLGKTDLFSSFMIRNLSLVLPQGQAGFMTPFVWMFISSYQDLRRYLVDSKSISSLIQLEYSGFDGATVPICTFTIENSSRPELQGGYVRLVDFKGVDNQAPRTLEAIKNNDCGWFFRATSSDFNKIPGRPIAYWVGSGIRDLYSTNKLCSEVSTASVGLQTGDNDKFMRYWFEVSRSNITTKFSDISDSKGSLIKWVPYNKGGAYRKWYGNILQVVNWQNDGAEIRNFKDSKGVLRSRPQGTSYYFKEGVTWSEITSSWKSFRFKPEGSISDVKGQSAYFSDRHSLLKTLAWLNSNVVEFITKLLNPTLSFQSGDYKNIPAPDLNDRYAELSTKAIEISKRDWDSAEISLDFEHSKTIGDSNIRFSEACSENQEQAENDTQDLLDIEIEINKSLIEELGLEDDVRSIVKIEQITLNCNPYYVFADKKSDEMALLQRQEVIVHFISYAVGCMFGRYSIDVGGLILANQGDKLEEYLEQVPAPSFMPDDDNVIPMIDFDGDWFEDDISERFKQFLKVTFGEENFVENLAFIEEAIGKDIKKYFAKDFYADHVKRYKKRPIYWLFSSPKGTFNALIYMHRYRPDTVSVILNDYLREFRTKLQARKESYEQIEISASASPKDKMQAIKAIDKINKVLDEVNEYERDILYPLAGQNIEIDLDDGVKHNYPLFGKALKKIAGLS